MSNASKVKSLKRVITGLFVTRKTNVTFVNRKEDYFKQYYFKVLFNHGVYQLYVVK